MKQSQFEKKEGKDPENVKEDVVEKMPMGKMTKAHKMAFMARSKGKK